MSKFFESEVVRDTVMELENMQRQLAADMIGIGNYSEQEKRDHLKLLKAFLEKQKLFFFRVSLSDDPDALMIKQRVLDAAKMFGYTEVDGMDKFFQKLDKTIEHLEQSLDRQGFMPYNTPVVIQRILIHPNQSYVFSKSQEAISLRFSH